VGNNYLDLSRDISEVSIKANQIQSTVTRIDSDLSTAKSTITQQADQISLRVEKGEVISEINQSAESIKISASKIDISGLVTITSLGTSGAVAIDAGNIKASGTITGVKFSNGAVSIDDSDIIIKSPSGFLKCNVSGTVRNLIGYSGNNLYIGSSIWDSNVSLYMRQRYIHIGDTDGTEVMLSGTKIGFYGATPVYQQSVNRVYTSATLATLIYRFNALLTALDAEGIIASNYQE
jgi:hypothetical protein